MTERGCEWGGLTDSFMTPDKGAALFSSKFLAFDLAAECVPKVLQFGMLRYSCCGFEAVLVLSAILGESESQLRPGNRKLERSLGGEWRWVKKSRFRSVLRACPWQDDALYLCEVVATAVCSVGMTCRIQNLKAERA